MVLGLTLVVGWYLHRQRLWSADAFGRTPAQRRDIAGVPAPVWFVCAAVVYLSQVVFATLALRLPPDVLGTKGTIRFNAVTAAAVYSGALAVCVLLLMLLSPRLSDRSGTRARLGDVGIGMGCLALAAPVYLLVALASQIVHVWITGSPPPRLAHDTLKTISESGNDPSAWVLIAAVVVLAPIVEECIYRVFLQSCFIDLTGPALGRWAVWGAIGITSVIFALAHVDWSGGGGRGGPVPWVGIPGLLVLGACMGIAYERTRRLGVPIVMHIGFNAINVAITLLRDAGRA